ncbi:MULTISPECIES: TIGR03620 family F420-dependent LLM class oxidoreductase [unclassified Crossiella]|uniref:TIGR03620 family F420-dependent LLM class oxidoreductase n=1 Tax=unclassified Crossiella TaxID=2620835 RepID=UPI001FFFD998|nr:MULTISPECIES: TIGR03620 family F420-dependent LLM class oxidoreductase [unclassified Crossiella]MCK2241454.1 TIGR03620 family F420-dependent LLM class oxidoreductase [Crossiella sp. S99.2]MCK2255674.1 TIGR03620 family F420-dependent LLM class oxidoreductase [Crossiella sp. S99.1]
MTARLGTHGVWLAPQHTPSLTSYVQEAEDLGYGTAWIGHGNAALGELEQHDALLSATSTITVASAIVNMWTNEPEAVARGFHRIADRHGERFLLGVGVGHPEAVAVYQKPYAKVVEYLDRLDEAGVPRKSIVLAALGPKTLKLAGERTLGATPYLMPVAHTAQARELVGDGLLVPEQTLVVDADPARARAAAREFLDIYLGLRNYMGTLVKHGLTEEEVARPGSDRMIDLVVPFGSPEQLTERLAEQVKAGADHVGIQVVTRDAGDPMPGYRALATALW